MSINTSDNKMQQSQQQYMEPWSPTEDEISFLDLWEVLSEQKKIIFLFTFSVTVIAVVYALISPVVYKAEVLFLPPTINDIQPITINIPNIPKKYQANVGYVYKLFQQNLQSTSFQREFLRTHTNLEEGMFYNFSYSFKVDRGKSFKKLYLSFEGNDVQQVADIANQYSHVVEQKTIQQLVDSVTRLVSDNIKSVEDRIAAKREIAMQRKKDKIIQLTEALSIALKLKQYERIPHKSTVSAPLYYRGSNEIQAEINAINSRQNDDSFIDGLRDLQEELAELRSFKIDESKLRVINIDQQAYPPEYSIKPKRKLIITLGFILGLMLGVFAAFFINSIKKNRKIEK